jgi:hypothetical protein
MSTGVWNQEAERAASGRRGRRLEYLTIGWNSLEGLFATGAGLIPSRR